MKRVFPKTDLYGLTDSRLCLGRSNIFVVQEMLKAGIKIIQYREKYKKSGVMLEECLEISRLCKEAGACFIVNDHTDIARLCDADGVHVGQEDLPVRAIRDLLGPEKIIGLSTHSPEQAAEAAAMHKEGILDYIGVGPIYATKTKVDVCDPVGLEYLEHVAAKHDIPFVAIGGIKLHNLPEVLKHGATCCALVSEIVGAEDIQARVAGLRDIFKQYT